jgi:hypothetical protein
VTKRRKTNPKAVKVTEDVGHRVRADVAMDSTKPDRANVPRKSPSHLPEPAWLQGLWLVYALAVVAYLVAFYQAPVSELKSLETNATAGTRLAYHFQVSLNPEVVWGWWTGGEPTAKGLLDRLPIIGLAGLITIVATFWGACVLSRLFGGCSVLEVIRLTRLELLIFSVGIGLALLSTVTFVVGCLGLLSNLVAIVLGLSLLFTCLAVTRNDRRFLSQIAFGGSHSSLATVDEASSLGTSRFSDASLWWLLIGVPFVACIFLGSLLPPFEYDMLAYHMQVPKEWAQSGRIGFVPHNIYGNMPLAVEMHSLAGMVMWPGDESWWYGALVGKTLSGGYALLTAAALFAMGDRWFGRVAAIGAFLSYLTLPWTVELATIGYNEPAYVFYLVASLYAVFLSVSITGTDLTLPVDRNWFTRCCGLAGFFAGAAFATKYPAFLFVVSPMGAAIIWLALRSTFGVSERHSQTETTPCEAEQPRIGESLNPQHLSAISKLFWPLIFFGVGVLINSSPWMIKNGYYTGNPVYPLAANIFGDETRSPELIQRWQKAHEPKPTNWAEFDFHGQRVLWGFVLLAPLMLPLSSAALFAWNDRRMQAIGGFAFFTLGAWWFATHRLDRFLFPLMPLLCLLSAVGLRQICQRVPTGFAFGMFGMFALLSLQIAASPLAGDVRYLAAYSTMRQPGRETPESTVYTHPELDALSALPDVGNVLVVGEAAVFPSRVPVLFNTCFNECRFEQIFKGLTPKEQLAALHEQHITHVLIDWAELKRLRSTYGYSEFIQPAVVQQLVDSDVLVRISSGENHELYRVP